MSSNPDAISHDLDRTDELPRLDVEAYEAALANNERGLARTDTWSVSALQEIEVLSEASAQEISAATLRGPEGGTLTGNVESILKRIADLEADVVSAHEANEALQKRGEVAQADRDRLAALVLSLEAENDRQREHRELAQAMTERVERKQRDALDQANARTEEVQSLLAAERLRAHAEQSAMQARLAELTSENARLVNDNGSIQTELAAARALSQERAEAIIAGEDALHCQKILAAQLTRQLAAKLADCDKLSALVEARDRTVEELIAMRDGLDERLRESDLRAEEAQRELDVGRSAWANNEQRKLELSTALDEAQQTIASLRDELDSRGARIDALTDELNALLPLEGQLAERTEELERREKELERLRAEFDTTQTTLAEGAELAQQRAAELDAMRSKLRDQAQALRGLEQTIATRDELAEQLSAQLKAAQDERAVVLSQLEKARRRVKVLTQEVFRRDHRIGELHTELTVHTEALAAIRRDVNKIGHNDEAVEQGNEIERILEPVDHAGPAIVLSGKMLTVGRTTESDVCIPSKLVSRNHARLLVGPTGIIIEDTGSTNGCYVNGKQVRKHLMHDGDVLELGDLRYRLQTRSTLGDTKVRANVIPMFEPRTQ